MDTEGFMALILGLLLLISMTAAGYYGGVQDTKRSIEKGSFVEHDGRGYRCQEVR